LISANIFAGVLKVGATPVPHAELLNYLKSDLKKEGVDLKIVEFTDFVTINEALIDGELDANYWQHLPHLTLIMQKEKKTDLVAVTKVHVETIGLYSTKIKSIKDLKVGAKIAIPSDSTNEGRVTANYALQAGFVPSKDAILLEDKNSPYVNVLVTRKKNQNNEDIKKLAKALNSEKARKFINEKYKGAVVPAF